jgi:hypothetical protein
VAAGIVVCGSWQLGFDLKANSFNGISQALGCDRGSFFIAYKATGKVNLAMLYAFNIAESLMHGSLTFGAMHARDSQFFHINSFSCGQVSKKSMAVFAVCGLVFLCAR